MNPVQFAATRSAQSANKKKRNVDWMQIDNELKMKIEPIHNELSTKEITSEKAAEDFLHVLGSILKDELKESKGASLVYINLLYIAYPR